MKRSSPTAMLEKLINKNHNPIELEKLNIIRDQLENKICKIILGNGERGIGFFCKIPFCKETIPALLTCNHFINETIIKKRETIYLSINDNQIEKEIKFCYKRKIYTSEEYDTTIIEILPKKDEISEKNNFLNLDININKNFAII